MDGSKCIMQLRGVRPFFSDKFDITKHKQYPMLSDYDKKNEFDIEKYVKNLNKLRFKQNDVVDEVCDVGEITALLLVTMSRSDFTTKYWNYCYGSFSEKSQIRTAPFFISFFKKKETNKWAFLQHQ